MGTILDIIRIPREADGDAIHPGYGVLSKNPGCADAYMKAGIAFIGPTGDLMRVIETKTNLAPRMDVTKCEALAADTRRPIMASYKSMSFMVVVPRTFCPPT